MHLNDPIGDLLTRLRNAQHGRRTDCKAPWSRIKQEICELLKREGYVRSVEVIGSTPHQEILVSFHPDRPALQLKRASTPGSRRYVGSGDVRKQLRGFDTAILSTSAGLLTHKQAREKKVGGELLCLVS